MVTTRAGGIEDRWGGGRSFRVQASTPFLFVSRPFGYQDANRLELVSNERGELVTYRHWYGGHAFNVDFAPPLPPAPAGFKGRYQVSLDRQAPILGGAVTDDATGFLFAPNFPDWAQAIPLRSDTRRISGTEYELRVSRAAARQ